MKLINNYIVNAFTSPTFAKYNIFRLLSIYIIKIFIELKKYILCRNLLVFIRSKNFEIFVSNCDN